jgi:diguanylate cyclase (GGDEF)-like protein/PAS domain S-box-containing protein
MKIEKAPPLKANLAATLRSQGRLFRALSRQSTDIMFVLDNEAVVGFVSSSCEDRLGSLPTELVGSSFFARVDPADRDTAQGKLHELSDDVDSSVHMGFRYMHASGAKLRMVAEAMPCELSGHPTGILLTLRDVTVETKERRELQKRERWLRAITRNALDMLTIVPVAGPPEWLGGSIERILGYTASELQGAEAWAPVHSEDLPRLQNVIEACGRTLGESLRIEYRMQRKNGAHIHVETLVSNCLDDPDVRGIILNTRDITDRIQRDPLTGLANRGVFLDRLTRLGTSTSAAGRRSAVLVVGVDRFKSVNDSFGLHAGDSLLVGVAERLASWLRPGDTLARIGGDEFALLYNGVTDDDEVQTLAEGIHQGLANPFQLDAHTHVYASASIGFAVGDDGDPTAEKLLGNALTALHRAKSRGRGRRQGFAGTMRTEALREVTLEHGLHQAIRRGEFSLHYQPILRLDTPKIVGLEALLRWRSEGRGFISPAEFIPAAEEAGLIFKIEEWVLRSAFQQNVLWRKTFPAARDITLSINLSAKQLARPDLTQWIDDLLAETGADPTGLQIEVTESAFIDRPEQAATSLQTLRERGFRLALDDFGTGYASLAHLHRFPFTSLKVDQGFIARLGDDEADRMVSAIITMATGLGLQVVAEGIETREQLRALRSMGCVEGQGYLFAKPMTALRVASYFQRIQESTASSPLPLGEAGHL